LVPALRLVQRAVQPYRERVLMMAGERDTCSVNIKKTMKEY
jgi:hypothetical protein